MMFRLVQTLLLPFLLQGCVTGLSGQVTDGTGEALDVSNGRINVYASDAMAANSPALQVVSVEEDGRFKISNLDRERTYAIEILVPGYEVASQTLSGKSTDEVRVELRRIPRPDVESIAVSDRESADRGLGSVDLTPPQM